LQIYQGVPAHARDRVVAAFDIDATEAGLVTRFPF
jgi:hypothetical protein